MMKERLYRTELLLFSIIATVLFSCGYSKVASVEDYNKILNDPRNGCIVQKEIAGVEISVKYQPSKYILMTQLSRIEKSSPAFMDSLRQDQDNTTTFLMTLAPKKKSPAEKATPIMNEGISSYSEYADRVMTGNFFMDQHVKLYVDGVENGGGVAIMENTYELSDKRDFLIVFPNQKNGINRNSSYIFVFEDPFFQMGNVQFHFMGADLAKAGDVDAVWN